MKETERQLRLCPLCGKEYIKPPAISRRDNTTPICPDCGIREALESIGIEPAEQEKILKCIHSH